MQTTEEERVRARDEGAIGRAEKWIDSSNKGERKTFKRPRTKMPVLLPRIVTHSCAYSKAIHDTVLQMFCVRQPRKKTRYVATGCCQPSSTICKVYSIIRNDREEWVYRWREGAHCKSQQSALRTGIDATEDGSSSDQQCRGKQRENGHLQLHARRRRHYSLLHGTRQVNSVRLVYPWTNVRSWHSMAFSLDSLLGWLVKSKSHVADHHPPPPPRFPTPIPSDHKNKFLRTKRDRVSPSLSFYKR